MGEFSHGPAWLPRLARSNCCQGRLHQGKFNNPIVLSSMNIVLQLGEVRLSTPPPLPRKGGLLPYVVSTGVYRWTGYDFLVSAPKHGICRFSPGMVSTIDIPFCFSALNRVRVSNSQLEPTPKHWSKDPVLPPPPPWSRRAQE